MREILFRGKRTDNGEWVYGDLIRDCICNTTVQHIGYYLYGEVADTENDDVVSVIPETVGQYTGLKDKNGKKIFDGDILYSSGAIEDYSLIVVRFDGGLFFDYYLKQLGECHDTEAVQNKDWTEDCEIIGNIHDNPELLRVE